MPDDGQQSAVLATAPANDESQPVPAMPIIAMGTVIQGPQADAAPELLALKVGGLDERGNTVKYIYARDPDYVVYYSRLEHEPTDPGADRPASRVRHWLQLWHAWFGVSEREGVQAQFAPAQRQTLRRKLLPLGTERANLQALLSGWKRRQSYDTTIATAFQLALDGDGDGTSAEIALDTLKNARSAIVREREVAGRAQYVMYTLISGAVGLALLLFAQGHLFQDSGLFWLGAQAGLIGAILSIALSLRSRTVALDLSKGNLSDSASRIIIGAVSGGTLVLLFSCGLVPPWHTLSGDVDAIKSPIFAMLLGIIAGFVEKLVPSLLDDQARVIGQAGGTNAQSAGTDGSKAN